MLTEGPHAYLFVHIFIICDGFSLCESNETLLNNVRMPPFKLLRIKGNEMLMNKTD